MTDMPVIAKRTLVGMNLVDLLPVETVGDRARLRLGQDLLALTLAATSSSLGGGDDEMER